MSLSDNRTKLKPDPHKIKPIHVLPLALLVVGSVGAASTRSCGGCGDSPTRDAKKGAESKLGGR